MNKMLSIGKRLGRKTLETGSWGLRWVRPRGSSLADAAPARNVGFRFHCILLILLALAAAFFCASPVAADDFDESPPEWEFLLWGGQPSTVQPKETLTQVPVAARREEREERVGPGSS